MMNGAGIFGDVDEKRHLFHKLHLCQRLGIWGNKATVNYLRNETQNRGYLCMR